MGQKVHPVGFRIGITEEWRSRWYAPKAAYAEFLIEDHKIRKLIDRLLNRTSPFAGCAGIEIERTRNEVKVVLATATTGQAGQEGRVMRITARYALLFTVALGIVGWILQSW